MRKNLPIITWGTIGLIMLMVTININWGKDHWKQVIRSDAEGYYAWLPAVFIYHDLNFSFFDHIEKEKYHDPQNFYDYRTPVNGLNIDKYYCGTALTQSPFFLIAHLWAYFGADDQDGYSRPYALMVTLASWFYLMLGLFFLNRLLKTYGVIPWIRALVLAACLTATNLFYYAVGEPGMSHVYSFAFFCVFLFYTRRFLQNHKAWDLLFLSVSLGIIVLIRPINALILLSIPFLAGGFREMAGPIRKIKSMIPVFILSVFLFIIVIAIQGVLNNISTGSFLLWSYVGEGFDFSAFHMHDFLFSYKKGFFLYTPIAFVSLIGFIYLYKRKSRSAVFLNMFLLIVFYVLSSWWNWWYGGSFSSRVMVEYLPLFMILLGIAFQDMKRKWGRGLLITLVFLSMILCQVQTYQYRYHLIHWENMNKASYWSVFMRIDLI